MPSKSYDKFKKTIARCEDLVRTFEILHLANSSNANIPAPRDIIRGAVVLSVSAFDAYVTDVFTEKLVNYLKRHTPDDDLIDFLREAGLGTREALTLINMERPYRRIRNMVQAKYSTYTTQRFDVVDAFFLHYRLQGITASAESMSGRKTLKRSVGLLIARRHDIAHDGDYNGHGRIKVIREDLIKKRIKDLELLVSCMDQIICNRIR
jgi:hypothetical protein